MIDTNKAREIVRLMLATSGEPIKNEAAALLLALADAHDSMAKDAARYRWLRVQPFDEVRDMFALHGTEQTRDAAIDAAMAYADELRNRVRAVTKDAAMGADNG